MHDYSVEDLEYLQQFELEQNLEMPLGEEGPLDLGADGAPGTDVRSTACAGAGLSKPHIEPAHLTCWLGGSLVTCSKAKGEMPKVGGGQRGVVKGMSAAARRRMMLKMATLDRRVVPLFLTLTYPDKYPDRPADWSRHMNTFSKRLARRGWGAVWRKEFKARKSGESEGKWAPHFHCLVWGCTYAELFLFARKAWYEIVKSGDERHARAGVRVEELRSVRGVRGYVSKYIGKGDEEDLREIYPDGVGRMWGVLNDTAIAWAHGVDFEVENEEANKLFRLMRRYMRVPHRAEGKPLVRLKRELGKKGLPTMNLMCDVPERWFDGFNGLVG